MQSFNEMIASPGDVASIRLIICDECYTFTVLKYCFASY